MKLGTVRGLVASARKGFIKKGHRRPFGANINQHINRHLCEITGGPPSLNIYNWQNVNWLSLNTRMYSQLRGLTSCSCGGLQPLADVFFCHSAKKRGFNAVCTYFRSFWCSVVTSITFSSNLSIIERNPKNPKISKKVHNFFLIQKFKRIRKIQKTKKI